MSFSWIQSKRKPALLSVFLLLLFLLAAKFSLYVHACEFSFRYVKCQDNVELHGFKKTKTIRTIISFLCIFRYLMSREEKNHKLCFSQADTAAKNRKNITFAYWSMQQPPFYTKIITPRCQLCSAYVRKVLTVSPKNCT